MEQNTILNKNGFLSEQSHEQIQKIQNGHGGTHLKDTRNWIRSIGVDYTWTTTLPERPYLSLGVYLQVYPSIPKDSISHVVVDPYRPRPGLATSKAIQEGAFVLPILGVAGLSRLAQ
jgi:hypothetical protein